MKYYPAQLRILFVLLLAFLSFFLFPHNVNACETQTYTDRQNAGPCEEAQCGGQTVQGTWQGYVKYIYDTRVSAESSCTQLEYFPDAICNVKGPRAPNPCPAQCDPNDPLACGDGTCASGNSTAQSVCIGGNIGNPPYWCQGFSCGYKCSTANRGCNRLNIGEGIGTTLAICQSACVQTPPCNTRVECDSSTCSAPTAQCGLTSGTEKCEFTSHTVNGSNCIRAPAQDQSCSRFNGSCPSGQTCVNNQCTSAQCNNNRVKDNGETGVDCGGGGCPACPTPSPSPSPSTTLSCDFTYVCKDLRCDFSSTYKVNNVSQTSYQIKYDFGDNSNTGNWKAVSTVRKLYGDGGTYKVALETQKNDGSGYCKKQKDVTVTEPPQLENCKCGDVCSARCCDPGENSGCPSIVSPGSRCRDGLTCNNGVCSGPICGVPAPPPGGGGVPPADCKEGCIDDSGRQIFCGSDQATTSCRISWLGNTSPLSVGEKRTVDRYINPGGITGDRCNDPIDCRSSICGWQCNFGTEPDPDSENQVCTKVCKENPNDPNPPPREQIADIQVLLDGEGKADFKDIHYTSTNPSVCEDPPDPRDGFFNSIIKAVAPGTASINADVYMQIEGGGHYLTCSCGLPLTVKALPSCLVDLVPSQVTVTPGQSQAVVASIISQQDGTVSEVHFASADTSVATVSPESDNTVSYSTNTTGVKAASSTKVTATAHMDPGHVVGCSDTSDVSVNQSGPWWQTKDGDVASNASISSYIPKQCVDSSQCTEEFSLPGDGGYPGLVIYGISSSFGQGKVSGKGWLANSVYAGRRYDYAWFSRLAPAETFTTAESIIEDAQIPGGELVSGFQAGGYVWRYQAGDLSINGTANLGDRKVILFVNGNLKINDRITLNKGKGFFMAIVKGDINIDASVSHPNQPSVEGLYLANGTISTGSKIADPDKALYVRGALVGLAGVNLQRDLDPKKTTGDNALTAAEFIEYAPDLIFTFPRDLARSGLVWREVAP